MRKFCFMIACLIGGSLAAETIGNVQFQFPPSPYNWVLLTDTSTFCTTEESCGSVLKIYTHKTGDALEFFMAASIVDTDPDEEVAEDEQFQTAEFSQLFLNDLLMPYFPNHRITITNLMETQDQGFVEWEMSDGIQMIFYGLCRYLKVNGNDVMLSYMTSASKNADNTALWTDALYQAMTGN